MFLFLWTPFFQTHFGPMLHKEHSLSYYLSFAGGKIIGFMPFLRVLVLYEMQSASSRI